MVETLVFTVICVIEANLLTWLFIKIRPTWSRRRVSLMAALPVPLLMWSLCTFLFVDAMSASKEECGMAAVVSIFGAAIGLAGYIVGVVMSVFTYSLANRPASGQVTHDL